MTEAEPLAGRLTPEGHVLRQRVYYEDTDTSGLVYHARYLHFMERGRSDYLRLLGLDYAGLAAQGLVFAVRRMGIEFQAPARIDDVVTVTSVPVEIGGARIVLDQSVARDGRILVAARVTVALIGADGRAKRLPDAVRDRFRPSPAV